MTKFNELKQIEKKEKKAREYRNYLCRGKNQGTLLLKVILLTYILQWARQIIAKELTKIILFSSLSFVFTGAIL